jgi:putative transposase
MNMQTVKIIPLKHLSHRLREQLHAGQLASGEVYTFCKNVHLKAREENTPWPGKDELQKATKGQYPLHSQSIQMVTHAFLANVKTTRELRKSHPEMKMRYPWRDKRFYPLLWPAQAVKRKEGRIILPMGQGRASIVLKVSLPEAIGSCKIVWRDGYELHVCMEQQTAVVLQALDSQVRATVDLGQIHQCAVSTNTGKAMVVSGRGIRAVKRARNVALGEIAQKRARCTKGSRRWRKLQGARCKVTTRAERRCRDLQHKGTAKVIAFCRSEGVSRLFVGNPDGVQRKRSGRHQNQRMSQWEFGRDIRYLEHKSERCGMAFFKGSERGTSSVCPDCEHKQKARGRLWQCRQCGFLGHRDVVGSVNMHKLAFGERVMFPEIITYLRAGAARLGRGVNNRVQGQTSARSSSLDAGQRAWSRSCLELKIAPSNGEPQWGEPCHASDGPGVFSVQL